MVMCVRLSDCKLIVYITVQLYVNTCLMLDFFDDKCTKDAAEECSIFRTVVPLSKQFNSEAFKSYCG